MTVAAVAILVYANTASYGAAWDDTRFVFQSGANEGAGAIPSLFTRPMLRDVPPQRSAYRPLTTASYALDWTLSGGRPEFFHKVNIALHALVSVLVLALLGGLGAPLPAASIGALTFAVHPVHVEAVANIAGRSELLAALWSLLAVLAYLRPWRMWIRMPLVSWCYALALLSKEHAIVVPALLLMMEAVRSTAGAGAWTAQLRRAVRSVARSWALWAGLVAVTLAYLAVRRAVLGTLTTADVAPFIGELSTLERARTAMANWTIVARLFLAPVDLVVDYGPAVVLPVEGLSPRFFGGLAVGSGALGLAWWAWRRAVPVVAIGVLWIGIAALPTSNLLVPIAQWLAERFLYLPSVGFAMVVGAGVWRLVQGIGARERRAALAALSMWGLFLTERTWDRNRTWADSESVIATLIVEHPESFRAQWYLGRLRFEQGRLEEAFAALDSAAALQPRAIELPLERAEWLLRLGRPAEADALLRALPFGRHADREAHLVRALVAQGMRAEADSLLARAREVFPRNPTLLALADSLAALPDSTDLRSPEGEARR